MDYVKQKSSFVWIFCYFRRFVFCQRNFTKYHLCLHITHLCQHLHFYEEERTAKTYHKESSVVGTIQLTSRRMLGHKTQQRMWSREISTLHLSYLLNSTHQSQTQRQWIVKTQHKAGRQCRRIVGIQWCIKGCASKRKKQNTVMMAENESCNSRLKYPSFSRGILELRGTPRIFFGRERGGADPEAI